MPTPIRDLGADTGRFRAATTASTISACACTRAITASSRGTLTYIDGDFYGGTRVNINGDLTWRPSSHFRTSVGYNYNEIELPQGNFETRLVRLGFDVVFSSTLSRVNLMQYDNVSHTAGVNMRLHWIPEPGREVYFVVNQGLEDGSSRISSTASSARADGRRRSR